MGGLLFDQFMERRKNSYLLPTHLKKIFFDYESNNKRRFSNVDAKRFWAIIKVVALWNGPEWRPTHQRQYVLESMLFGEGLRREMRWSACRKVKLDRGIGRSLTAFVRFLLFRRRENCVNTIFVATHRTFDCRILVSRTRASILAVGRVLFPGTAQFFCLAGNRFYYHSHYWWASWLTDWPAPVGRFLSSNLWDGLIYYYHLWKYLNEISWWWCNFVGAPRDC